MPLLPGGDSDLQRAIFQALRAGDLRLIGPDGLDRAVARPGDIGVGQSSLRLARPETGRRSMNGIDEQVGGHAGLFGTGGSGGAGIHGDSGGGWSPASMQERGGGVEDAGVGEQELAFTLMTSLTDETKRDGVRLLLRNLANAIDEGKASYAQLMIKVIVDVSIAEGLAEDIRVAGTSPTVKDV
jgi:hypothetical protein